MKRSLRGKLPLLLPEPCPICGAKVHVTDVDEWECESGSIIGWHCDCETEPDIDSDDWPEWFHGHYAMPYVDWMPYQTRMLRWLNARYHYREGKP